MRLSRQNISIVKPSAGSIVSGQNVLIRVRVTDNKKIAKIVLSIDERSFKRLVFTSRLLLGYNNHN